MVTTTTTVEEAGEELGKSLAKIMFSQKYEQFHDDTIALTDIIRTASNTAIGIIQNDGA